MPTTTTGGNLILEALYSELTDLLEKINGEEIRMIPRTARSIELCQDYMQKLRTYILDKPFESADQEVYFFKIIKPKFHSQLLYYQKIFTIETSLPLGSIHNAEYYLRKELEKVTDFYIENSFFFQYYRSGNTLLDNIFFIRGKHTNIFIDKSDFDTNPEFTTTFDYIIAKIMATELIQDFVLEKMESVMDELNQTNPFNAEPVKMVLQWTDSKAALIELMYALQKRGSFNNGRVEVKDLAVFFEKTFGIDLKNFYRSFQDIQRRGDRTAYLNTLSEALTRYMNDLDLKASI
jgi:hypothetical protein